MVFVKQEAIAAGQIVTVDEYVGKDVFNGRKNLRQGTGAKQYTWSSTHLEQVVDIIHYSCRGRMKHRKG